jgi:hypothetical protein
MTILQQIHERETLNQGTGMQTLRRNLFDFPVCLRRRTMEIFWGDVRILQLLRRGENDQQCQEITAYRQVTGAKM